MPSTVHWEGPFAAVVTPFDAAGAIRYDDFATIVERFVANGATGVVVSGHNGESWALELDEQRELVRTAREAAGPDVPVLCGLEHVRAAHVVAAAEAVAEAGAAGVMIEPPYVVTTSSRDEALDRFGAIAEGSPVPLMLYNNPRRTQIDLSPELIAELAAIPNVAALKDANRDLRHLTRVLELCGDTIAVFAGPSALVLPGVLLGARGFVSSGPLELLGARGGAYYRLLKDRRLDEALPIHTLLSAMYGVLFGIGTWPAALKASLEMLGYPAGVPRAPVRPLDAAQRARLRALLVGVGLEPVRD
jgi:4-hydroxy-tetrahydrodipicolinate synthase